MTTESHAFKTELKQLLDIIIHSLYSNKDIFLRELISNACDAIDKIRFESLTNQELLAGDADWKIKITPDEQDHTLTISDNGVGMSRESIVEDLGTIARSGTQAFLKQLEHAEAADRPDLIGQFGVGFYACLMVADRVTVVSRPAGADAEAVQWETDGQGTFTVQPATRAGRGTDVILHIKEEDQAYLQPWKLREIVKKYSDFIEHPIVMDREEEKEEDGQKTKTTVEEVLNSRKALWLRPRNEITPDDYKEFYHHVSHNFDEPRKTIHYTAEGVQEFTALLFLPEKRPFDLYWPEAKFGLQLYVRRVFITDSCEKLLPPYLRFVKGVVDSSDLPLNVSREVIQQNPLLDRIRGALVKKVLSSLEELRDDTPDDYRAFFADFGPVLKEGVSEVTADQRRLADLLLFETTRTEPGERITLADYVKRMPVKQKAIYYLIGENRALVAQSPLLETFRARDYEVLLLTDTIDEWALPALNEYEERPLKPIDRGEFEDEDDEEKGEAADARKEAEETYKDLCGYLKEKLDDVKNVRLSRRLKESAACLVADEDGVSAHLERLLKKMGQGEEMAARKRVLELNPDHPAVQALQKLYAGSPKDPRVVDHAHLLLDQAIIAEGSAVRDPAALARRINALLAGE